MTHTYDPNLVPWTPPLAPERHASNPYQENAVLHLRAEVSRLTAANNAQGQEMLALVAALNELHAILSERGSSRTDRQRIELASQHVVRTLARIGTFPVKVGAYVRARS